MSHAVNEITQVQIGKIGLILQEEEKLAIH